MGYRRGRFLNLSLGLGLAEQHLRVHLPDSTSTRPLTRLETNWSDGVVGGSEDHELERDLRELGASSKQPLPTAFLYDNWCIKEVYFQLSCLVSIHH